MEILQGIQNFVVIRLDSLRFPRYNMHFLCPTVLNRHSRELMAFFRNWNAIWRQTVDKDKSEKTSQFLFVGCADRVMTEKCSNIGFGWDISTF